MKGGGGPILLTFVDLRFIQDFSFPHPTTDVLWNLDGVVIVLEVVTYYWVDMEAGNNTGGKISPQKPKAGRQVNII